MKCDIFGLAYGLSEGITGFENVRYFRTMVPMDCHSNFYQYIDYLGVYTVGRISKLVRFAL